MCWKFRNILKRKAPKKDSSRHIEKDIQSASSYLNLIITHQASEDVLFTSDLRSASLRWGSTVSLMVGPQINSILTLIFKVPESLMSIKFKSWSNPCICSLTHRVRTIRFHVVGKAIWLYLELSICPPPHPQACKNIKVKSNIASLENVQRSEP